MYTSDHDMYAVKYQAKDSSTWVYVSSTYQISEDQIDTKGVHPKMYLCKTKKEAEGVFKKYLMSHKEHLSRIKLSVMNSHNLKLEMAVSKYEEFK